MNQTPWLIMGLVAIGVTAWTLRGAMTGRIQPTLGSIAAIVAMLLWARFGLAAFGGVEATTECCTTIEYYEGIGWLAIAFAGGMLVVTLKAILEMAGDRGGVSA